MAKTIRKKNKKKKVVVSPEGIIHIKSNFNNIIITATNKEGQTIAWASAGQQGFKGAKKSTPFAARQAAHACAQAAYDQGLRKVTIHTKGIGPGREHAIRGCTEIGIDVGSIIDLTPEPHNGCRPSKQRHP